MDTPTLTLIQPRHSYAPESGEGHIYLSAPLLSIKARLLGALGKNTSIQFRDENLEEIDYSSLKGIVGINAVGAPYIPIILEMIERISHDVQIIIGGQIISSLSDTEFSSIFCKNGRKIINGNKEENLETVLSLEKGQIPNVDSISLIEAYKDIPDEQMTRYLEKEFSLYVSQGCKYNCSFCQAKKAQPERYRDMGMLESELTYLAKRGKKLGTSTLQIYMSNLDLLQTPVLFSMVLDIIERVRDHTETNFRFRGLCGIDSFLKLYEQNTAMLVRAKDLGLCSLGYGVDGATAEVWKQIGKGQNYTKKRKPLGTEDKSEQAKAIETIRKTYELGVIPEVLMVFGHPGETNQSLKGAYDFCVDMQRLYSAVPRPHVAKHIIPGTKAWGDKSNVAIVQSFIQNPNLFQVLDYTALPSEYSHPDKTLRNNTRRWFIKICNLSQEGTQYIIPNTPHYEEIAKRKHTSIRQMNENKFDR